MKLNMYPKLAFDGMKKNGRLYIPYLVTCILMVTIFYILHFLGNSGVMAGMPGGGTATDMLRMGTFIMSFFGLIFLFFTQSTLIKGRKKEFGLYSILGMNKKSVGRILFFETIIIWGISLAIGLIFGIGLSKLAELGFTKMIGGNVRYTFSISFKSLIMDVATFSVIFFLIYINSVRQIRFASPTELVRAGKEGEKPPKANWVMVVLGLAALGGGYYLALSIEQPIAALMWFFVAVILVIIGTYYLLIAGSVIMCKMLQKNKKYYYKTNHFVSVSSMTYRMKRNGASLASICILLTIVLVIMSSTSALYSGSEKCLDARYPNEIGAFACKFGYDEELENVGERMNDILQTVSTENGATVANNTTYATYSICGYLENSTLQVTLNSVTHMAFIDYDHVAEIQFLDIDDYNRITGSNESVADGDVLLGTAKDVEIGDVFTIGDVSLNVSKRIDDKISIIDNTVEIAVSPTVFVVVNDKNEIAKQLADYKDYNGSPMLAWYWYSRFDTGLDAKGQVKLAEVLDKTLEAELNDRGFSNFYCESHEAERDDFVGTFGGLFFLGIMLSIIFMVSCVIIIYYKQVSEGFEDRTNFEIMKKVGMTDKEIKSSVNSQMFTVFMIPIIVAAIHLLVVLPIVNKLLMLFGLYDVPGLIVAAALCVLFCGVLYALVYKLTSNAYYRIVSD